MFCLRRLLAVLAVLALFLSPMEVTPAPAGQYPELCEPGFGRVTLAFRANATTGYFWSAEILSGDSAMINESAGGYVSDPNPEFLDGVGGTEYYVIDALKSGETLILFTYSRGGEDRYAAHTCVKVTVGEDLLIRVFDVSDTFDPSSV